MPFLFEPKVPRVPVVEAMLEDSEFRKYVEEQIKLIEEDISKHDVALTITENMNEKEKILIKTLILGKKLKQIQKLVYTNILTEGPKGPCRRSGALNNGNKNIYPRLLSKYDELLNEIIYNSGELVNIDVITMDDYMGYCKNSGEIRNLLKTLCEIVEK